MLVGTAKDSPNDPDQHLSLVSEIAESMIRQPAGLATGSSRSVTTTSERLPRRSQTMARIAESYATGEVHPDLERRPLVFRRRKFGVPESSCTMSAICLG